METILAMLEEGCTFVVLSSDGSTVLHFTDSGGHNEVVRELVSKGCDVNAQKTNGCCECSESEWLYSPPLAAVHGRLEAVRELINLGAKMSTVADSLGTPLNQAAIEVHACGNCSSHVGRRVFC